MDSHEEHKKADAEVDVHPDLEKGLSEQRLNQEGDDEWTWESYSDSIEICEEVVKPPKKVPGEREQIGPVIIVIEPPEIPEILLMDQTKKLSKKVRNDIVLAKREYDREMEKFEEEERLRLLQEAKEMKLKQKTETQEQIVREDQLSISLNVINNILGENMKICVENRKELEWKEFLKCDGLPDPYECGQLNTYLHLWDQTILSTTIDQSIKKTDEALKLLETLQFLIDDFACIDQRLLENWKWIHFLFRQFQQKSLDTATYKLLRDVENNLNRLNLTTADYRREEKNVAFCLWVLVTMPTSMPNPRKPPTPQLDLDFPEMAMSITFPPGLNCRLLAIRAMYLKYDHLSDLCETFRDPPVPEKYKPNLLQTTSNEWKVKLIYKYEGARKIQKKIPLADLPKEKRLKPLDPKATNIPELPYVKLDPTASLFAIRSEEDDFFKIREEFILDEVEGVLNLRKFIVIGGTYFLNLFYQPPQPQSLVTLVMKITNLKIPTCLYEVPIHMEYDCPKPADTTARRDPEEIEIELKKMEIALEKLILVTLTLPTHVMWLDVPVVCLWDKVKKAWVTDDIHDMKHIEEKGYVTFRTGRFGTFGIAVNRFANFPFQTWEIKPEKNGTVTFQIIAAILMVEFNVKGNLICLTQLQNGPNKTFKKIIGIYYKFPMLVRILRDGGADFFPGFDTFSYVESTWEKNWPMERHLYYNMAQLSVTYNFTWSRWNFAAGRRSIVMQMREYKPERTKQVLYSTLLVTPLKANLIDCTEISQEFSDVPSEGMQFYSDLFHLMKGITSLPARNKINNGNVILVGKVAELLISTRVLSLS